MKKNIGRNPIGDCQKNKKRLETNKESKKKLIETDNRKENSNVNENENPIRKWK